MNRMPRGNSTALARELDPVLLLLWVDRMFSSEVPVHHDATSNNVTTAVMDRERGAKNAKNRQQRLQ